MRTGIYCGSFNPVHKGHIKIVRECLKQDLVDRIFIIPTGAYWNKNDLLDISKRVEMLRLYENEKIRIACEYSEYPYTYQIFEKLEQDLPEDTKYLILGADNIEKFDEWREYEYLLTYPFIIIKRNELKKRYIKKRMKDFNKENYEILNINNIDISSTYIRDNLDDYDKVRHIIDKKVYEYLIKERN